MRAIRPEPLGFELFCARIAGGLILVGLFGFIGGVLR